MSVNAILQQSRNLRHNSKVTNSLAELPPTLEAAEEKFSAFLTSQEWPETICWVTSDDLLVGSKTHHWIRVRPNAAIRAAQRYADGFEGKLGIEVRAICATQTETFASVFVPEDDLDAQYHLMGRGLKCTCPVKRYSASGVRNPLKWLALCLRYRQGRNVQDLFE
jgi:hypothetical protein